MYFFKNFFRYFARKLVRGVNFPFVFIRNTKGDLELEIKNIEGMSETNDNIKSRD